MTGIDLISAGPSGLADDHIVSARLIDAIDAVIGPSLVIDTAFPRASVSARNGPGVLQILCPSGSPGEQEFWLRFRQAGGHEAIVPVTFGSETFTWPPPSLRDRSRTMVLAFDSPEAAQLAAPCLRSPGTALLFETPSEGWTPSGDWSGYDTIRLNGPPQARALALMVWRDPADTADQGRGLGVRTVHYDDEARPDVIEAVHLIHDGGYLSEGDAKYSWLWTGPSHQFRFVLPKAHVAKARLAEICFPRTEDPFNLDHLAVQVNGRPVPFEVDRWSDTSGKAKVPLSGDDDTWVMTLVVPRMTSDGQSDRRLGLCLDKVILSL